MAQPIEQSLLQAIKKDDVKAFKALAENARGEYRLGRFPVLSLLYLYKSRRLLSEYEQSFLKINKYEQLREPVEVSKKFSGKAGKCLRLYLNEVVTPPEMLLILNRTGRLKRIYPLTNSSEAVQKRLKSIYSIRYSLNVKFEGNEIILDRRPLSYREKRNIAVACLCSVLAVAIVVGVPVTTVSLIPKPVEGGGTVTPIPVEGGEDGHGQIDFGSKNEYTLKSDIVLPENYSVEKVNCKIVGEGNKLILSKGATLGELNGNISDLIIQSDGGVIFTSISEKAAIENVTVNVSADITASGNTALVAATNYGTIDGVTVNVSGKINARGSSGNSELNFGGIVQNNSYKQNTSTQKVYLGIVKNCTVNYSQFTLSGEAGANAAFGGVAGINYGSVEDCTVTGEIIADTFDIAGVCSVNNGMLSGNVNEADILQTSAETGWNPISCGIVLSNNYAVENCENKGKISSVSTCGQLDTDGDNEPSAYASGIAYISSGSTASTYISGCTNYGSIESTAGYANVYGAGVCILSGNAVESCKNAGDISVKTENGFSTSAAGIVAAAYADIYKSVNEGDISASGGGAAFTGGINSVSYAAQIVYCVSRGDITVSADSVRAGGIVGLMEVTSDYFSVYWGSAEYCISEGNINVSTTGKSPAYVGGIAGYIRERGVSTWDGSVVYCGGGVSDCYFTGACVSDNPYFGAIVGVCGVNIYESNVSGNSKLPNFDGNFYSDKSLTAFGATTTEDADFASAEDKGADRAEIGEMQKSEGYKAILKELEK